MGEVTRDAVIRRLMALCDSGGWLNVYVEHAADDLLPWIEAHVARATADAEARLAAVIERAALLLCERHQHASPTRIPCAACSQDAAALDPAPTTDADGRDERRDGAGGVAHNHRERVAGCFRCDLSDDEPALPQLDVLPPPADDHWNAVPTKDEWKRTAWEDATWD